MRRVAFTMLLIVAPLLLGQGRTPLTRGLANALYVALGGGSTVAGTTNMQNVNIIGTLSFGAAGNPNGSITTDGANWTISDVADGTSFLFDLNSLGITQRTLTVPDASGILILDTATQTLTNKTIIASGTITPSQTVGIVGTTTNNNVQAGSLGEFVTSKCPGPSTTATITVTIASPAVVTWSGHPFSGTAPRADACPVVFTTTGALPTGITAGTNYWVVPTTISGNTFSIATSIANAISETKVNTSGTQSGTHTGTAGTVLSTGTTKDVTGIFLTAGDWDCSATSDFQFGATTSFTNLAGSISTATNTLGGQDTGFDYETPASVPTAAFDMAWPISNVRQLLGGSTNVLLTTQGTFTVSTLKSYGSIRCRRTR